MHSGGDCSVRGWMRSWFWTASSCGWLFAALLVSPAADAGASHVWLEWDAPAACPDVAVFSANLSQVLGREPADFSPFERVRGVVIERGTGWQLTLELDRAGQRSSRVITANGCDDLVLAGALAIALALDEQAGHSASAPHALEPGVERAPAVPSPLAADTLVPNQPVQAAPVAIEAEVAGVFDLNSFPTPVPGLGLQARLRLQRWLLGVSGTLLPMHGTSVRGGQSVDFGLLAAGIQGCGRFVDGVVHAAACTGIEAGQLAADGGSLVDSQRVNRLWLAPHVGLDVGTGLGGGLGLQVRGEALLPLVRPRYVVDDQELVHRPPLLAVRLYLGLGWAFDAGKSSRARPD